MNTKRLVLAAVAAFVFLFLTDFLIHGVWLVPDYKASSSVWRTDEEMMKRFVWMLGGHLILAVSAALLWARGFAGQPSASTSTALCFGVLIGLFAQANTLITYVVVPMPGDLAVKWFVVGMIQAVLLALVIRFAYGNQSGKAGLAIA